MGDDPERARAVDGWIEGQALRLRDPDDPVCCANAISPL